MFSFFRVNTEKFYTLPDYYDTFPCYYRNTFPIRFRNDKNSNNNK